MTLIEEFATMTPDESQKYVLLSFPYHEQLIDQIKTIPGRDWDPRKKVWIIPIAHEEAARCAIRPYFQIEGEESFVKWKTIKMIVTFEQNKPRRHRKGVLIDGQNIINPNYGNLYTMATTFDILESTGGFTLGDEHSPYFDVRYEITIKIRENAVIEAIRGTHEIVQEEV